MYSVDIHAHFYTRGYIDILEKHGHTVGVTVERGDRGDVWIAPAKGRKQGPIDSSYYDVDDRVAGADRLVVGQDLNHHPH